VITGGQFSVVISRWGGSRQGEAKINVASAISLDCIEELFIDRLEWQRQVFWDDREGRVVAREERRLGALILASRPVQVSQEEAVSAALEGIRRVGLEALNWTAEASRLVARVRFVERTFPKEGWPDFTPGTLLDSLELWLGPFLSNVRSWSDLARLDLVGPLRASLEWSQQKFLDELAPTHLPVPSGSRIALDYQTENNPILAVKLQELFGLAETPRVAGGRVPVLLHLLSPARRPIQVTQNLRSFWDEIYPEVKKELKGRYSKHPWPDDPWSAAPTRWTKKRK